eukprot:4783152-Alexandrium_andersonii.AAC.1
MPERQPGLAMGSLRMQRLPRVRPLQPHTLSTTSRSASSGGTTPMTRPTSGTSAPGASPRTSTSASPTATWT